MSDPGLGALKMLPNFGFDHHPDDNRNSPCNDSSPRINSQAASVFAYLHEGMPSADVPMDYYKNERVFGDIGREIADKVFGPAPFKVGDLVRHPFGHLVEITDGEYWGRRGLSNFWYWRDVLPDGTLSKEEKSGYGWRNAPATRPHGNGVSPLFSEIEP